MREAKVRGHGAGRTLASPELGKELGALELGATMYILSEWLCSIESWTPNQALIMTDEMEATMSQQAALAMGASVVHMVSGDVGRSMTPRVQ